MNGIISQIFQWWCATNIDKYQQNYYHLNRFVFYAHPSHAQLFNYFKEVCLELEILNTVGRHWLCWYVTFFCLIISCLTQSQKWPSECLMVMKWFQFDSSVNLLRNQENTTLCISLDSTTTQCSQQHETQWYDNENNENTSLFLLFRLV